MPERVTSDQQPLPAPDDAPMSRRTHQIVTAILAVITIVAASPQAANLWTKVVGPDATAQRQIDDLKKQNEELKAKAEKPAPPVPTPDQKQIEELKKQLDDIRKQIGQKKVEEDIRLADDTRPLAQQIADQEKRLNDQQLDIDNLAVTLAETQAKVEALRAKSVAQPQAQTAPSPGMNRLFQRMRR